MANGFTGQISLEYEGRTYGLTLDFNAMADFEAKTGKDSLAVIQRYEETGQISMVDMRALFWAGLSQDHPELTLKDAGRIMSANTTALQKLLEAMQPEEEPGPPAAPAGPVLRGKRKARRKVRAG